VKLLEQGLWRQIPAVETAVEIVGKLEGIGMEVAIPSESELAGILRVIKDPSDEEARFHHAHDKLVQDGVIEPTFGREIFGPLALQDEINPPTWAKPRSLQCGSSFHAFLSTGRFTRNRIPAGTGLFDTMFDGLTPWCVTSLLVEVEPKSRQLEVARRSRQWKLARAYERGQKGDITTAREQIEMQEAMEAFDELDLTAGGVAWFSLAFMVSAGSPEELEEVVRSLRQSCSTYGIALRRIQGESLMQSSLETVLGF
jgi:hypothetical protein